MTRNSYWVAMVNECHVDSPTNEAFAFEMAENGCMEETEESIYERACRSIEGAAAMFGFDFERIVPLECSMRTMFEVGGVQFNLCDSLQFSVAGKGWSTDFDTLAEAPQYDEKKEEEE